MKNAEEFAKSSGYDMTTFEPFIKSQAALIEHVVDECVRISEDSDFTMTGQGHAAAEMMKNYFEINQ